MLSNNGDRDFLVACAYPTKQMFAEMRRNAIVLMCRNAPHTFSLSLLRKWRSLAYLWDRTSGSMHFRLSFLKGNLCNKNCIQRAQNLQTWHISLWSRPHLPQLAFSIFSLVLFFLFSQLCAFCMTPWLIPDRWWIGTKQSNTTEQRRELALSQTLWRQPRDVTHWQRPCSQSSRRRPGGCYGDGASSQLINGARALRDRSSVRHLRGPHTCIDLHFFAYV